MKKGWTLVIAVGVTAGLYLWGGAPAFAQFHEPGNLVCTGCHTLHYSENNAAPPGADAGGPFAMLLKSGNSTNLCLTCHDQAGSQATFSYAGSTPPKVKGTVTNQLPGGMFDSTAAGAPKGHTLAASPAWPGALATAPGSNGTYSSAAFGCTACHDAHGADAQAYPYRNLRKSVNGVNTTLPTDAIASAATDRATLTTAGGAADQNAAITPTNKNVYHGEFGRWCGACHSNPDNGGTGFHGTSTADPDTGSLGDWIRHPTGTALLASYVTAYGDTAADDNYDFTHPVVAPAGTGTVAGTWAVTATHEVFCLTCHKAHGNLSTGYDNAVRWDLSSGSGGTDNARTKCGKCHNR